MNIRRRGFLGSAGLVSLFGLWPFSKTAAAAGRTRGLYREQQSAVAFIAANSVVAMPVQSAVACVLEVIEGAVIVAVLMIEAAARCGNRLLLLSAGKFD